ncbi:tyrosine-protein kinase-like otk [Anolis sagrei]|uniref:tyrosine-protein kinase-like otk n=1 Tax=Anolis sagrei TaxID=38937 RepID=UPI003521DCF1
MFFLAESKVGAIDGEDSGVRSHRMERRLGQIGISLQQGKVFLPLMFIIFLFSAVASPGSSLILSPSSLSVLEGSTVKMSCKFQGNITGRWYCNWYHNETRKLNSSHIITDKATQVSNLTLKRVDIEDSGTYHCQFGNSEGIKSVSYRTELIVQAKQSEESDLETKKETPGCGVVAVIRLGAEILLVLLLLGFLGWRYRKKRAKARRRDMC